MAKNVSTLLHQKKGINRAENLILLLLAGWLASSSNVENIYFASGRAVIDMMMASKALKECRAIYYLFWQVLSTFLHVLNF